MRSPLGRTRNSLSSRLRKKDASPSRCDWGHLAFWAWCNRPFLLRESWGHVSSVNFTTPREARRDEIGLRAMTSSIRARPKASSVEDLEKSEASAQPSGVKYHNSTYSKLSSLLIAKGTGRGARASSTPFKMSNAFILGLLL